VVVHVIVIVKSSGNSNVLRGKMCSKSSCNRVSIRVIEVVNVKVVIFL